MSFEEVSRLIKSLTTEQMEALASELEKKKQQAPLTDEIEELRKKRDETLRLLEEGKLTIAGQPVPKELLSSVKSQIVSQYNLEIMKATEKKRKETARRERAEARLRELLGVLPPERPSYAVVPAPELIGHVEENKGKMTKVEQKIQSGQEVPEWQKIAYERYKALEQIASTIKPVPVPPEKVEVTIPVNSARSMGFNVESLEKIGKTVQNLMKGISWYVTGQIDPEEYEDVSAAVKSVGTALMSVSPIGMTAAGAAAATGLGAPVAGAVAGVSGALGLIGWFLNDNVAGRIDMMKYQLDKEKKEAESEEKRKSYEEAKANFSALESAIITLRDMEKVADSYYYAKDIENASRVIEGVLARIQELKEAVEGMRNKLPSDAHADTLLESLRAVENVALAKKRLYEEKNPQRHLVNAQVNFANALKILSDFMEKQYEKRPQIDVRKREEKEILKSYEKLKAADVRAVKSVGKLSSSLRSKYPTVTYQKSKLTTKRRSYQDDPELYSILMKIAQLRGFTAPEPEKLPEIAGLPGHVLEYPIIVKVLTYVTYNPKTPLAAMPNAYWNQKAGKSYNNLDRYLFIVALTQAGINSAEVAHLKEYELEALLRFRQYMYAAMKRGYFLPWEFELYTRFKELTLVDDEWIIAVMGMELPEEVRETIAGEKLLEVSGTTYITPASETVETGVEVGVGGGGE